MAENGTANGTTLPEPAPTQTDGVLERFQGLFDAASLGEFVVGLGLFFGVFLLGFAIGRGSRAIYHKLHRSAPTGGQLLVGKMMHFTVVLVSIGIGLWAVYDVNPLGIIGALGLASIALGFGLQNTVANIAAGVGLTLDKPFEVGDRIRVGQTWGDVASVGLRSTRIVTVNGETVIIPNAVMDTQEVWNHTSGTNRKLRLDLPIGISYDSSFELAEHVLLEEARGEPLVLAYPEPVVRLRGFGENQVDLELRCWLKRAEQRPAVVDKLLRGIKEGFDREGIHFPFPQRTVSYLKDIPPAAPTPDFLHKGHVTRPVVLVIVRDRPQVDTTRRIVEFVKRVDARLVALHVRPPRDAMNDESAQAAVNRYLETAQEMGVPARGRVELGNFVKETCTVAKETGAKLVLLGDTRKHRVGVAWHRGEMQGLRQHSPVPVLVLDTDRELTDQVAITWRMRLHEFGKETREEERAAEDPTVEDVQEKGAKRKEKAEEAEEETPGGES